MQFLVNGARVVLESFSTKQNLRVREDSQIDGLGGMTQQSVFIVHNPGSGKIRFQSEINPAKFLGLLPSGKVVACTGAKEGEFVVVPSTTGGDMVFLADSWPAKYYLGVNTNGHPMMCNPMNVGQFGAFVVKMAPQFSPVMPMPGMPQPGMPMPMPVPGPGMIPPPVGPHHHMIPGVPMPGHQVINKPGHHVVITPNHPSGPRGHNYSRARILKAKYGDFASKKLADVTDALRGKLDPHGKINIGPNYNAVFGDPCYGVVKALLVVWSINDRPNDNDIHWGIVSENKQPVIDLSAPSFDHTVSKFPAGVYGDFASGKYTDIRPVFEREFKFMTLNCPSYNGLFGDPAPGIRKALVVFYDSPCYKYMRISSENELKVFDSNDKQNEVIYSAFGN